MNKKHAAVNPPSLDDIRIAEERLKEIIVRTPLLQRRLRCLWKSEERPFVLSQAAALDQRHFLRLYPGSKI